MSFLFSRKLAPDTLSYLLLLVLLFVAKGIELRAGVEYNLTGRQVPLAGLLLYGLLGAAGLWLTHRTGFPQMWEEDIDTRLRFLLPAGAGMFAALGMIAMDVCLEAGRYPQILQTELPEGLLLVIIAGISEELVVRLFLIPFLVWLVSTLLLGGRRQTLVFWSAAILAAILYSLLALGVLLSSTELATVSAAPPFYVLGLPTILLYSLLAAYFFRRAGFLAVLSLRFGFYFVWHILWPLV